MSMPRAVRHINEMRVLDAVFRHGRISRAGIARELGLTRSTAGSIVAALAAEGVVTEDGSGEDRGAGTGRPGTFVRLNPHHGLFLGADIGVGRIVVAALDFQASPVAVEEIALTPEAMAVHSAIAIVASHTRLLVERIGLDYPLRGLCLTVPGVIDGAGQVLRAPLLGWHRQPVLDRLSGLLPDVPVLIAENDANAFAIADTYGARREVAGTEIHIFLDAGVGGAIINNGQILRGQDGYAGEFGHIILADQGFVRSATPYGSLESFIGRDAILARFRHHGGSAAGFEAFLRAARAGEAAAIATLSDWSFSLARGLALFASIFNPARIVLGGPVAALFSLCERQVLDGVRGNLLDDHPLPAIALSHLGAEGTALGAAAILHRKMLSVDEELVFGAPSQRGDITAP